ncbi:MAG: VCBS repeat-containing protein, partial [Phycisphaerales bacterium]|nr:VCBS repeat-containing protein [Phycisphaerales bacterium]
MNHTEAEPPVGRSGRPGASPGTDPIGADEVAGDDAAVGRAFRVSLAVIGGLAIAGAAIWWVSTRPAPVKVEPTITPEAPNAPTRAIATIPAIPFTNMRAEAGIAFERENGARGEKLLPETMGGGVAVLDYDNDGDEDLFFVNGMPWSPEDGPAAPSVLYRNDGGWRFTDVTAESGPALVAQGMGTAVGDYDNDGWRDLFVTTLGRNRLFHNDHGHFREVTDEAGVGGEDDAWSTGAAFADYDNDGDLDLFVANYVKWSRDIDFEVDYQMTGVGRAYGPPTNFQGTQSVLYRNDGDGRFTDVSESAGVLVTNPATGVPVGKGLAVAPVDLDGDGWIDFVVANDTVQNFVFHNQGDGRFREVGVSSSLAFDRNGSATGAMGIDAADYRNANVLGIAVG